MARYHYDVSLSRQKRFRRRFKELLILIMVLLFIASGLVIYDALHSNNKNGPELGQPKVTELRPAIKEFDSDYFSFTAPTNWQAIAAESRQDKYVYRSFRGNLVEHEFKVYIGSTKEDISATRALPVRIDVQNKLIPSDVTEHCSNASSLKKSTAPVSTVIGGVAMLCQLDGTNYLVVVGLKEGDTNIKMLRPDGSSIIFSFIFRSSTVPPESLPLVNILNSFTVR